MRRTQREALRDLGFAKVAAGEARRRLWSVLVYLSDAEGGETIFPNVGGGLTVSPVAGRAIIWENLVEDEYDELSVCDSRTLHRAAAVTGGVKYALQRWYTQYPLVGDADAEIPSPTGVPVDELTALCDDSWSCRQYY
eukprot:SAG11_NODE_1996_length_3947_cov_3.774688_5_plen_138_part_00